MSFHLAAKESPDGKLLLWKEDVLGIMDGTLFHKCAGGEGNLGGGPQNGGWGMLRETHGGESVASPIHGVGRVAGWRLNQPVKRCAPSGLGRRWQKGNGCDMPSWPLAFGVPEGEGQRPLQ